VGPRHGERRLSRADQKVIDLVAAPIAIVLHAQALTEDLKASRERVIDAADEERTRLRRELHDSLGPLLTGAAFKADGIALAAQHRPERAESLALELADQLRQSIEAVRQLAYGLRPAALDELGLVGALREEGSRFEPLTVTVDAPEFIPALPSSVEVAAYRIADEALANVVRHSDAKLASVRLTANDGTLEVIITDDGSPTAPWSPGLGLTSIQTRASEVGGACEAGPTAQGGRGGRRPSAASWSMIKVLVADDHPVVRDGLRALFVEYPTIELIGEAATGREAIKAAVIDKPDVIIMDLAMPDTDGFSATAEISRVAPDVAVLVLTMSDDDVTMTKAMRAGARGYLLKGATKEEILRAVTAVADGQAIFGPAVAQRVLARLGARSSDEDPFPQLTPREHDVLRLLAKGLSNSAIADRLGLSLKTVNNNTSSIFTKLNVATRTEAAILARDRGLDNA
jgi:DNA-binding NarL/FixJ family response regulator